VLEVAVSGFDSAPYGIAVRKDSPELLTVLSRALALIQADGTYERILRDWGLEDFPYGD
jgi:polar amino acid transport system substrate-binding protein